MKSLLRPDDRAEVLGRLDAVQPDAGRKWGRMSVDGMLCHLADSFAMVLGERGPMPAPKLHERTLMRWVALSTPVPWPKGVPTAPAVDQEQGGTPPSDFERDKKVLREVMERFLAETASGRLFHPVFGKMSPGEWGRWGYRHLDHHLRQFGT